MIDWEICLWDFLYALRRIFWTIWQLPQHILGRIVICVTRARYFWPYDIYTTEYSFGICLGEYIIVSSWASSNTVYHERGHRRQSRRLGPLYLLIIGIPSACGNIWDRVFHKKWVQNQRELWYYSLPWERWADRLGGVKR